MFCSLMAYLPNEYRRTRAYNRTRALIPYHCRGKRVVAYNDRYRSNYSALRARHREALNVWLVFDYCKPPSCRECGRRLLFVSTPINITIIYYTPYEYYGFLWRLQYANNGYRVTCPYIFFWNENKRKSGITLHVARVVWRCGSTVFGKLFRSCTLNL